MKSTKIDNDLDFKRKLLWCLFWANRKAIRRNRQKYDSRHELNLEEQDRNSFQKIKKLYEQELKKLQIESSK